MMKILKFVKYLFLEMFSWLAALALVALFVWASIYLGAILNPTESKP